jgi:predicted PurR-regulated permease PerM
MLLLFNKTKISGLNPSTIVFTVFFLLGLYFLYLIRDILTLIFLAFIIMVALRPISRKLQHYLKMPAGISIFLSYLLLIVVIGTFLAVLVPPLLGQLVGLVSLINLPGLQDQVTDFKFTITELSELAGRVGTSVGAIFSIIGSTFSTIFTFFTLLVVSYFLLSERDHLPQKLSWIIKSPDQKHKFTKLLEQIEEQLGGWVRGELILMLIIGLMTFVGLTALGVPYALPLAILAGMLEIVPNIGPTIAAVPAIALAYLSNGWVSAGSVLILNLVIQQLENNFLVPKVMKASANVNPLASILAILIGLNLGGVMGALLAVPLYIVARTVYFTYFYEHRL